MENRLKDLEERIIRLEKHIFGANDSDRYDAQFLDLRLGEIFEAYPRHEKKFLSLSLMARKITNIDIRDALMLAVRNFADYCKSQNLETKYIMTFPNFFPDWRDWLTKKHQTNDKWEQWEKRRK